MEIKIKTSTTYLCSLERAFKTPLLCGVSKVHNGFGLMPKVTHCTEDENWGKIGSTIKINAFKPNPIQPESIILSQSHKITKKHKVEYRFFV